MFTVTHSATRLIGIAALLRALPWAGGGARKTAVAPGAPSVRFGSRV